MVRGNWKTSAFRPSVAAPLHSQLGLGHRRADPSHQFRALSAQDEELALHAGDAESRAGDARHPRPLQEILHDRSPPKEYADGNGGGISKTRNQSHGPTRR